MPPVLIAALLWTVLVAAVYDLRYRRIPNWVSLSGLVLGFGCNILLFGLPGFRAAGLGLLSGLAIYLPLYLLRGMGAGDVKLMAAVGAIVGPRNWFEIFLATALIGGVTAIIFIAAKHRFRRTMGNVATILSQVLQLRSPAAIDPELDFRNPQSLRLPHAVAIAGGAAMFLVFNMSQRLGLFGPM